MLIEELLVVFYKTSLIALLESVIHDISFCLYLLKYLFPDLFRKVYLKYKRLYMNSDFMER